MTNLSGKTILITGANGGFGQAMIQQFLQKGAKLILTDLDQAKLAQTIKQATSQGQLLGCIASNLATTDGVSKLYEETRSLAPHIDVLVNNAGIAFSGYFHDIPQEKWETLMQVNLLAPMRLIHAFLPQMIARKSGHIVNISSVAGIVGPSRLNSYAASKFGLRGLSESLHHEYKGMGVQITAVYPFFARTPILDSPQFGGERQEIPERLLYTPDFVVSKTIQGIEKNKLHVYPGAIPKLIDFVRRFMPRTASYLNGNIENKSKN